jgi:photosystem I subunit 11
MANFIKPYNNDLSVGHLSTPITNSAFTKAFLGNLPAYRPGLSSLLRGLEIGMAHGYFLIGPFDKLGPLRNSPIDLLVGFLSTIGLIIILSVCLRIYGTVTFQKKSEFNEKFSSKDLESYEGWSKFSTGFLVGALGGASVAYLILSNLPN